MDTNYDQTFYAPSVIEVNYLNSLLAGVGIVQIGNDNTALGVDTLQQINSNAHDNSAFGYKALENNISGCNNTAIGSFSLSNNDGVYDTINMGGTGCNNTAVGYMSLFSNKSGKNNCAFGSFTLDNNINGTDNVGIGTKALYNNINGTDNVGIGTEALYNNINGTNNVAIGSQALYFNNASDNIGIGNQTLLYNSSGNFNIGIGNNILNYTDNSNENIGVGHNSLLYNSGDNNTAMGNYALGGAPGIEFVNANFTFTNTPNVAVSVSPEGNMLIGDTYVYYSTDRGSSWVASSPDPPITSSLWNVAVNGYNMIVGDQNMSSSNKGVWYSNNSGLSWSQATQLNVNGGWNVAVSGSNMIAGDLSSTNGVWYSNNSGSSWTQASQLNYSMNWNVAVSGTNMIVGSLSGTGFVTLGIWYSIDSGLFWTQVFDIYNDGDWNVSVTGLNMKAGDAGGNYGVWYSTDSGTNWTKASPLSDNGNWNVAVSDLNMIAGSDQGIYTLSTVDINNNSWVKVLNSVQYSNVAVGSNYFLLSLIDNGDGIVYSSTYVIANNNVAIGNNAGQYCIGDNNTFIGNNSGNSLLISGNYNTLLGYNANIPQSPSTTGPTGPLGLTGNFILGDSNVSYLWCNVQLSSGSDRRDKTNIESLKPCGEFIDKLNPVSFDWNIRELGKIGDKDVGFIAQELQQAQIDSDTNIPGLVSDRFPEKLSVCYQKLIPVLVKEVQDLRKEINILKEQLKK